MIIPSSNIVLRVSLLARALLTVASQVDMSDSLAGNVQPKRGPLLPIVSDY